MKFGYIITAVARAVVVWLVISFVGLLLPIFLGLAFFLFLAPSARAQKSKKYSI